MPFQPLVLETKLTSKQPSIERIGKQWSRNKTHEIRLKPIIISRFPGKRDGAIEASFR